MTKERTIGEKFRPIVTVKHTHNGQPDVLEIGGLRYVLDHVKKARKANEVRAIEREVLLDLLRRKGIPIKYPYNVKLEVLYKLILGGNGNEG